MSSESSILKDKRILAVDDEEDILETIVDILEDSRVDTAHDYESASEKIARTQYDLAILDIMGVDGLTLLDETVARGIPTVMLTAHAISPEALMESIRKGAISYLPKEALSELDDLLASLLNAYESGTPPWKLLFERLGDYFDQRFGPDWKKKNQEFWDDFSSNWQVGRGIQKRLMQDSRFRDKGF